MPPLRPRLAQANTNSPVTSYVCLSCRLNTRPYSHESTSTDSRDCAKPNARISRRRVGRSGPRSVPAAQSVYNGHTIGTVGTQTPFETSTRHGPRHLLWDERVRKRPDGTKARASFHSSIQHSQQAQPATSQAEVRFDFGQNTSYDSAKTEALRKTPESQIRKQLRQWQDNHGAQWDREHLFDLQPALPTDMSSDGTYNFLSRMGDEGKEIESKFDSGTQGVEDRNNVFRSAEEHADLSLTTTDRILRPGTLVELGRLKSEGGAILAIFVRHVVTHSIGQFLTLQGRWRNDATKTVAFSHPDFVSQDELKSILNWLPLPTTIQEYDEIRRKSADDDLDVPRHISGPLINKLHDFQKECLLTYRKNASALDSAHDTLAHPTDLRYGTLSSTAAVLLGKPADTLSPAELHTVQRALLNAGYGFGFDVRFHRVTGHLQIRSKSQVQMVEHVRNWMRHWQEDLALTASMTPSERARHKPSVGSQYVSGFVKKVQRIVHRSRQTRDASNHGNIGPSKIKRELGPNQDSTEIKTGDEFTEQEQELVRFIEAWALARSFFSHPRLNALAPTLLQATGLYQDFDLGHATGYLFLQEIGTVLPYENRTKYDPYLLLPSSQQSKPLQNLMSTLLKMRTEHDLTDSMADLRHDWGSLPVYCIDKAGAHEIDDGISLERSDDGNHWVHAHIANPTAFFARDHPIAKMARHMGETIYMPERAYMMMPRWATDEHFSLGPNRPCLTFSAKLGAQGQVLEKCIRSGFVRNVIRITPGELDKIFEDDHSSDNLKPEHESVIIVGGNVPPTRPLKNGKDSFNQDEIESFEILRDIATRRFNLRKAGGGVFLHSTGTEVAVWQRWGQEGLKWEPPYRKGSRTVEGDPVIRLITRSQDNWFKPSVGPTDILVREVMLLACEIAGSWCADRKIPMLYRGTVPTADIGVERLDPDQYLKEILMPAAEDNNGVYPLHLGLEYIKRIGSNVLSSEPLKHKVLGMDYYGKVTSPLRRYGDMVVHWQIEAALREEARRGRSLIHADKSKDQDHAFLPFSARSLNTFMVGLTTRERLIQLTKARSEEFWYSLALFRAFHYGEAEIPFKIFHVTVVSVPPETSKIATLAGLCHELGMNVSMIRPSYVDSSLGDVALGDVWECTLEGIDVYERVSNLIPRRLVKRWA